MPELPIVFEWSGFVCFPDGGSAYEFRWGELRDNRDRRLAHLREKRWWTDAHDAVLLRILGPENY